MRPLLCAALVLLGAAPGQAQQDNRWQVTLNDGKIVWDLRLLRFNNDTLAVRHADSTYNFPITQVDELRLVRKSERRLRGEPRGYGSVLAGTDDEVYRLTLYSLSERRHIVERVFQDHPPADSAGGRGRDGGPGASSDLWQITLSDGTIVWNLRLVGLVRDTIVFRQDSKTVRYPLVRVDEIRLVRAGEHEIGPVAAGGRYDGAANGASDFVYQLTLLDLPQRRQVIEQILSARGASPP